MKKAPQVIIFFLQKFLENFFLWKQQQKKLSVVNERIIFIIIVVVVMFIELINQIKSSNNIEKKMIFDVTWEFNEYSMNIFSLFISYLNTERKWISLEILLKIQTNDIFSIIIIIINNNVSNCMIENWKFRFVLHEFRALLA